MPSTLATNDRQKLIKLLGMIGSSADGEALNAARLAHRLLATLDLTWDDVLINGRAVQSSFRPAPPPPQPDPVWREVAMEILQDYPFIINEWEQHFLESILRRRSLTEKQERTLAEIAMKCGL